MNYQCVKCRYPLRVPDTECGSLNCAHCGFQYEYAEHYLRYNYDDLLYHRYRKPYLLWKVLSNNGYIAYQFLKEGSLSLAGRSDVAHFKDYILSQVTAGKVLDIGCGILEVPGYLDFEDKSPFDFYGLDPIDDRSFRGVRITGCSEYTPFQDDTFDAIVFATSLDHMCSLEATLVESHRILKHGGKIIIWMGDRKGLSLLRKAKNRATTLSGLMRCANRDRSLSRLSQVTKDGVWNLAHFLITQAKVSVMASLRIKRHGFISKRYVVYPNYTVLYIPNGGVDPFHSFFEGPQELIKLMRKAKFKHDSLLYNNKNEVFLSFTKATA